MPARVAVDPGIRLTAGEGELSVCGLSWHRPPMSSLGAVRRCRRKTTVLARTGLATETIQKLPGDVGSLVNRPRAKRLSLQGLLPDVRGIATACHAEGRGFESLQPLSEVPVHASARRELRACQLTIDSRSLASANANVRTSSSVTTVDRPLRTSAAEQSSAASRRLRKRRRDGERGAAGQSAPTLCLCKPGEEGPGGAGAPRPTRASAAPRPRRPHARDRERDDRSGLAASISLLHEMCGTTGSDRVRARVDPSGPDVDSRCRARGGTIGS